MSRTPDVRFKGFTRDWKEQSLDDTFAMIQNNTLSRAELNDESGAAVNIHYGDVLINYGECFDVGKSKKQYIPSEKTALKYKSSWLKDGDVVMADTAEDETAGKCTEMFGIEGVPVVSGLHTIPLRPKMEFAGKYLGFYMNSPAFHDQLLPFMHGIKVTSVSKGEIKDTAIRFPEVRKEQEALGRYFHDLDTLIEQNQSEVDRLQNLKKAMLLKMFPQKGAKVPEVRFKGLSGDWETKSFKSIATRVTEFDSDACLPHVEYEDLNAGEGTLNKDLSKKECNKKGLVFDKGDVLYGKLRPYLHNWLLPTFKGIAVGDFWVLRPVETDAGFLYCLIRTADYDTVANQSSGTKMPRADWKLVSATEFQIPKSIDEQRLIGQYFQNLDSLIEQRQSNTDRLRHLKQAMLQRMFI